MLPLLTPPPRHCLCQTEQTLSDIDRPRLPLASLVRESNEGGVESERTDSGPHAGTRMSTTRSHSQHSHTGNAGVGGNSVHAGAGPPGGSSGHRSVRRSSAVTYQVRVVQAAVWYM